MMSRWLENGLQDKLVVVVGGSKGIGKETAKEIVRRGGRVCIIARDEGVLSSVAEEIKAESSTREEDVWIIAADAVDYDQLAPKLIEFVECQGVPDLLINAVGFAYPNYLEAFVLADFERNMQVNYYGQLIPSLILLPYMKKNGGGHISFISSMMGFMGMVGYAAYAPTKFAIAGMAESFRHELKPDNIEISVLYPPDTQTPGFEKENQTKPAETVILSENAKLYSAEAVAAKYVDGLLRGKFYILVGSGKWIWRLFRWFPGLVHWIMDQDFVKARQSVRAGTK